MEPKADIQFISGIRIYVERHFGANLKVEIIIGKTYWPCLYSTKWIGNASLLALASPIGIHALRLLKYVLVNS